MCLTQKIVQNTVSPVQFRITNIPVQHSIAIPTWTKIAIPRLVIYPSPIQNDQNEGTLLFDWVSTFSQAIHIQSWMHGCEHQAISWYSQSNTQAQRCFRHRCSAGNKVPRVVCSWYTIIGLAFSYGGKCQSIIHCITRCDGVTVRRWLEGSGKMCADFYQEHG